MRDYISLIISRIIILIVLLTVIVLMGMAVVSEYAKDKSIIHSLIIIVMTGMFFVFPTYFVIRDLKDVIKEMKIVGRYNIYIKNIGLLIFLIIELLFIVYCFLTAQDFSYEEKILNFFKNYYLIIILGFMLGIIIISIDILISTDENGKKTQKNIIFKIDKYND